MNLFIYPHAPALVQDSIDGFRDTTPFSADGIARHFSVTDNPEKADLFWMGQHTEQKLWLLHPNRFPYFELWPEKHIVDLEGDWRDAAFPDWLKPALIVASNWNTDRHGADGRILPRVIMSPLLMRRVRDPPPLGPPRGTYFSRRNAATPSPPLPACTSMRASSKNFMASARPAARRACPAR